MSWSIKGLLGSVGSAVGNAAKSVEGAVAKETETLLHPSAPPATKDTFEPAAPTAQDKYKVLNEPLFQGTPTDNFQQGTIGDCYVLSALASVAVNDPKTIENNIQQNPDGTYTVTFHEPPGTGLFAKLGSPGLEAEGGIAEAKDFLGLSPSTKTVQVTVDGEVPVDASGNPVALNSPDLWPAIYEKAMAKLMDGYPNMGGGGFPSLTMQLITGKPVKTHLNLLESGSDLYSQVASAAAAKQPMTASTPSKPADGLVGGHVYSVLGAVTENGQQYIQVRNPWGGANNGVQDLPLQVFKQNFVELDVGAA